MNTCLKITLAAILLAHLAEAQILDPRNAAKRKASDRANGRIDQSIDKGFDKVEEGIGGLFKRKEKGKNEDGGAEQAAKGRLEESPKSTEAASPERSTSSKPSGNPANLSAYSKFDFIPGEKVIAAEDFSQDAVGDFPAKWNTDGSGEVVALQGKAGKWLKFNDEGTFYPEFVPVLPENVTIQFELGADDAHRVMTMLRFVDTKLYPEILSRHYANQVTVTLDPLGNTGIAVMNSDPGEILNNTKTTHLWRTPEKPFVKVSVWRQKARLRVYLDETKVWDIPRAFQPGADYRMIFETSTFYIKGREVFVTDLRVASGLPDTRSKLLAEGKFVTSGILFDTNSDVIKPVSYAVLKEIGQALVENPAVKIRVTGHTDSHGDEQSNLALSAKRAAAVKAALVANWNIEEARIATEGQGESRPIADNATAEGRANNRRVEFVKL